jgi:hypothetical protein
MYISYRLASKKVCHTEISSFVEARSLSVHDVTTLMHMSQARSPASDIASKRETANGPFTGVGELHTTPLLNFHRAAEF